MKSLLIPFFLLSPVFAQVTPPTSIPLEETKSPFTSGDTLSNSRLFLNYSAEKSPTIHFGDHPVALPSGENISADLTFEHGHNHPATIHLRTSSDPSAQVITIPDSTISGSPANFQPLPGKDFPMDQTFTIKAWDLKRTKSYGSKHFNERELKVTAATLKGNQIHLTMPDLKPSWGMSIELKLTDQAGKNFTRVIHNSIFHLPE